MLDGVPHITNHDRIKTLRRPRPGPGEPHHRRTFVDDSIISRIPLFEGMSPEEQEELRAMMTQTTLRRGETLVGRAHV